MKRSFNPWLLVMLILLGIFVFSQFNARGPSQEVDFSQFETWLDAGQVASVTVQLSNGKIEGELSQAQQVGAEGDGQAIKTFETTTVLSDPIVEDIRNGVSDVTFRNPPQWMGLLFGILPIIILIGFFWFIFMRAQGGPSQVMQFGQSKAKTYGRENKVKTSFNDVAGHKEAKEELLEIVDFLKNPAKVPAHRRGNSQGRFACGSSRYR